MAADVTIPRLGWSMEEGVFAGWIKKPGDTVKPGEPLFMLEGEKATQEIEAVDGGVLHLAPDAPAEGQAVLVGRTIGKLCAAGETPTWDAAAMPVPPVAPDAPLPSSVTRLSAPTVPAAAFGNGKHASLQSFPAAASPSVRRLARQMGIDLAAVKPRLPGGRLSIEDITPGSHADETAASVAVPSSPTRNSHSATGRIRSSPRARRAAEERGLDIATIRGSGTGGRVRERDVLAAAASGREPRDTGTPNFVLPGATAVPITQIRRAIARQMVRSRQETVPVTLTAWVDATALLAARAALKAAEGPAAASLNDMLLKSVADTLRAHPLLAARWEETQLSLPGDRIDIGLAVDAPGGLVVPVVRDVAASPLAEVARQTRWLIERARSGRLTATDMRGGVFTLTSLGSYGIEFFTPVINHPEAAILGVGAIRMQPVPPPGGQAGFVLQRRLPLSLTFDHRIVDGGPAARFLGELAGRIAAFTAPSAPAASA
jgi:pyruvate dehydrogenase E2 component (dihydrolipoamide acetyltransferase)